MEMHAPPTHTHTHWSARYKSDPDLIKYISLQKKLVFEVETVKSGNEEQAQLKNAATISAHLFVF